MVLFIDPVAFLLVQMKEVVRTFVRPDICFTTNHMTWLLAEHVDSLALSRVANTVPAFLALLYPHTSVDTRLRWQTDDHSRLSFIQYQQKY
jgi:hypothetical protein